MKEHKPSQIALAFFHWFCRAKYREEIEGDLMERFNSYSEQYGQAKANRLFIKDVILLFRPTIVGNIYQLTNMENLTIAKRDKKLLTIVASSAALLLIPLVAMNFTGEVKWKILDFLIAGILLCGTGLVFELILRKIKTKRNRIILITGLFLALILIWVELAVGIFGTAIAGS